MPQEVSKLVLVTLELTKYYDIRHSIFRIPIHCGFLSPDEKIQILLTLDQIPFIMKDWMLTPRKIESSDPVGIQQFAECLISQVLIAYPKIQEFLDEQEKFLEYESISPFKRSIHRSNENVLKRKHE